MKSVLQGINNRRESFAEPAGAPSEVPGPSSDSGASASPFIPQKEAPKKTVTSVAAQDWSKDDAPVVLEDSGAKSSRIGMAPSQMDQNRPIKKEALGQFHPSEIFGTGPDGNYSSVRWDGSTVEINPLKMLSELANPSSKSYESVRDILTTGRGSGEGGAWTRDDVDAISKAVAPAMKSLNFERSMMATSLISKLDEYSKRFQSATSPDDIVGLTAGAQIQKQATEGSGLGTQFNTFEVPGAGKKKTIVDFGAGTSYVERQRAANIRDRALASHVVLLDPLTGDVYDHPKAPKIEGVESQPVPNEDVAKRAIPVPFILALGRGLYAYTPPKEGQKEGEYGMVKNDAKRRARGVMSMTGGGMGRARSINQMLDKMMAEIAAESSGSGSNFTELILHPESAAFGTVQNMESSPMAPELFQGHYSQIKSILHGVMKMRFDPQTHHESAAHYFAEMVNEYCKDNGLQGVNFDRKSNNKSTPLQKEVATIIKNNMRNIGRSWFGREGKGGISLIGDPAAELNYVHHDPKEGTKFDTEARRGDPKDASSYLSEMWKFIPVTRQVLTRIHNGESSSKKNIADMLTDGVRGQVATETTDLGNVLGIDPDLAEKYKSAKATKEASEKALSSIADPKERARAESVVANTTQQMKNIEESVLPDGMWTLLDARSKHIPFQNFVRAVRAKLAGEDGGSISRLDAESVLKGIAASGSLLPKTEELVGLKNALHDHSFSQTATPEYLQNVVQGIMEHMYGTVSLAHGFSGEERPALTSGRKLNDAGKSMLHLLDRAEEFHSGKPSQPVGANPSAMKIVDQIVSDLGHDTERFHPTHKESDAAPPDSPGNAFPISVPHFDEGGPDLAGVRTVSEIVAHAIGDTKNSKDFKDQISEGRIADTKARLAHGLSHLPTEYLNRGLSDVAQRLGIQGPYTLDNYLDDAIAGRTGMLSGLGNAPENQLDLMETIHNDLGYTNMSAADAMNPDVSQRKLGDGFTRLTETKFHERNPDPENEGVSKIREVTLRQKLGRALKDIDTRDLSAVRSTVEGVLDSLPHGHVNRQLLRAGHEKNTEYRGVGDYLQRLFSGDPQMMTLEEPKHTPEETINFIREHLPAAMGREDLTERQINNIANDIYSAHIEGNGVAPANGREGVFIRAAKILAEEGAKSVNLETSFRSAREFIDSEQKKFVKSIKERPGIESELIYQAADRANKRTFPSTVKYLLRKQVFGS